MNQQSRYIQLIGDLAIPLLGYYFWDWNIYFILFFYILDVLISTVFTFVKTNKINQHQQSKEWPWVHIGLILIGYIITFLLLYYLIFLIYPKTDLGYQLEEFLMHKDMGLPQWLFLFPILLLAGYSMYRMTFLLPKAYETTQIHSLWHEHIRLFLLIIAVIGLLLGISTWIVFPDWVYVWGVILGSSLYRNLVSRA
jgi:uncharacterized BrkB/YihY/UPF0761 family membrane protein